MVGILLINGVDLMSNTMMLSSSAFLGVLITGIVVYLLMSLLFYFLTKKEFNHRLSKHQERTYLYFKIRKCLDECCLNIENIHMKVLEYCDPEKDILDKLEFKYIEKYFGIEYGFNQMETAHLIPQFKPDDEYFLKFYLL